MCRQQSEVSTPNRTFGEAMLRRERIIAGASRPSAGVGAAEGHILTPKRGIAKGIHFKFPWLGRDHNSYFYHPKPKRPKPPHLIYSIHKNKKRTDFPLKNQSGKALILLKLFTLFFSKKTNYIDIDVKITGSIFIIIKSPKAIKL
ncbi:MAG: hypothetical protein J6564_00910 [Gilliamella sp.]|uniref:hypothetical protein n=1 Tax=Gilliamella sp. TaxID=1891236 RepID=UPI0025E652B5|nr:hypothetical protein [Gilliamella sp.]MCO6544373.1 hypothetical protein [Gilliamella sp.]